MKKTLILSLLFTLFTTNIFANQNEKIKIYTEHYPPYNMKNSKGKLQGISVEVLKAILKQMNSSQTIDDVKLRSWAKSYAVAQKVPNTMVFSTTRTASRENLFKWVGPIASAQMGIIALKEKNIKIDSIKDLENYRIGAVLKDIGELMLLDAGVKKENIQHVKGEDAINLSFKKMEKNRIDMFTYDTNVAFANAKQEGFDISKYEVVYKFKGGNKYYFAFNKNTDDAIIQKWQKALDEIKINGIFDNINSK